MVLESCAFLKGQQAGDVSDHSGYSRVISGSRSMFCLSSITSLKLFPGLQGFQLQCLPVQQKKISANPYRLLKRKCTFSHRRERNNLEQAAETMLLPAKNVPFTSPEDVFLGITSVKALSAHWHNGNPLDQFCCTQLGSLLKKPTLRWSCTSPELRSPPSTVCCQLHNAVTPVRGTQTYQICLSCFLEATSTTPPTWYLPTEKEEEWRVSNFSFTFPKMLCLFRLAHLFSPCFHCSLGILGLK